MSQPTPLLAPPARAALPVADCALPAAGLAVGGRYLLEGYVNRGGMGKVFRGWDRERGCPVAVKLIPLNRAPEDAGPGSVPADADACWWWEAQVLAAVRHPHVVQVYDVVEGHDYGYLIMEYVAGGDIKRRLRRAGRPSVAHALHIGIQVCDALDAVHRTGFIHRDVKPHNLLFEPSRGVKLADFGIAQRLHAPRGAGRWRARWQPAGRYALASLGGSIVGTAAYCSPEQIRGDPLSSASDLYSLGVVLFELLTGRQPFIGPTLMSVAVQHLTEPVPPLRSLGAALPAEVEQSVMRALEKDPRRRYPSARAMAQALMRALDAVATHAQQAPSPTPSRQVPELVPVAL